MFTNNDDHTFTYSLALRESSFNMTGGGDEEIEGGSENF